jgi:adenylylsulfate kinase
MNDGLGVTVWLTGLSAAGKTTASIALEAALRRLGKDPCRIDGDELRRGVSRDLGFSRAGRAENVRRAANDAVEAASAGRIAIVSLTSPFAVDRERARELHRKRGLRFVEVHMACPLEVAERRDPKDLYRRARAGEIEHMIGIHEPYEVPREPDLVLDGSCMTVDEEVDLLLAQLGLVSASRAATAP